MAADKMLVTPPRFQDVLTLLVAALVAWAVWQLAAPYGLPAWVMAGVGLCAGLGLAAWHLAGRKVRQVGVAAGESDLPGSGRAALWILAAVVLVATILRLHMLLGRTRSRWKSRLAVG